MNNGAKPSSSNTDAAVAHRKALRNWTSAILLVTKQLQIQNSPAQIHSAFAWARHTELDQAVLDISAAAGLAAKFARVSLDDLSRGVLPALVAFETTVSVITAVTSGQVSIVTAVDGKTIERLLSFDEIASGGTCRVLLVQSREVKRDSRVEEYLKVSPDSWLKTAFTGGLGTLAHLCAGSLVGNLLAITTSLFAMQVWDRIIPARSLNSLWVLTIGVGIALLLELLIRTTRTSIADHFGRQADLKLSELFFTRVLDIRNDARPRSPGQLISHLRDLEQVRELLTSSSMGVLIDIPFVMAFVGIIWTLGGPLVLIPLAAIPISLIPGLIAQLPLAKLSREGLSEAALRNAILMESIYRVEDIKTLQAETRFRQIWNQSNQVCGDASLKQRFLVSVVIGFSQLAQQLAYVGVLVAGVYGILEGNMSFGAVLACSILTSRTIAPLGQIVAVLTRIQNVRISKQGLDTLLSLPTDHDPAKTRYHKPSIAGSYHFQHVVYSYDPEDKPALMIQDLKIKPGDRIAILGKVGSGKSTFLRLAAGLASPTMGRILLENTAMDAIDVADIRRDIGTVLQDANLFYGTLRENIALGNPLANDDEILAAMSVTGADQLLAGQYHGLDFKIREGGIGLSGGQKQAVLLARTLLRSPQVLLLDEPTASLDEYSEHQFTQRMKQWLGRRTLVIATHRYPVLALVNRIIIMHEGRIVKDGPKEEILKTLAQTNLAGRASPTKQAVS